MSAHPPAVCRHLRHQDRGKRAPAPRSRASLHCDQHIGEPPRQRSFPLTIKSAPGIIHSYDRHDLFPPNLYPPYQISVIPNPATGPMRNLLFVATTTALRSPPNFVIFAKHAPLWRKVLTLTLAAPNYIALSTRSTSLFPCPVRNSILFTPHVPALSLLPRSTPPQLSVPSRTKA